MQFQEFALALGRVGQRSDRGHDGATVRALVDDGVGRCAPTRCARPGTRLLPEDVGWVQRLTTPRVHAFNALLLPDQVGLDDVPAGRAGEAMVTRWTAAGT